MVRSTVARVDLDALKDNFAAIREFLGGPRTGGSSDPPGPPSRRGGSSDPPGSSSRRGGSSDPPPASPQIIAVVKANAYGHGAAPVGLALEQAGAPMLACADIEEGVVLRRAGVRVPILVFGALSVSDLDGLFEFALTPTISTPSAARAVQAAAARRQTTIGYHLKIDTGMNRLGFRHDNLRRTLPDVLASANLRLDAAYTHFASADVPESLLLEQQRQNYDAALHVVDDLLCHEGAASSVARTLSGVARTLSGPRGDADLSTGSGSSRAPSRDDKARPTAFIRHAANSAATLRDSRTWYDAVRPGLLLYGIVPPPLASTIPLRPVMSLTSRVVAVKGIRPGEGVGYGWRFTAEAPRTIAVVPAGYADGLDTRLSGRGHVLVRGKRVPVVGAVSMDMITVDVTGLDDVQPGDEVVILGTQGEESWQQIDARELAASVGMIPWEVVCRLGSRIERVY